MSIQSDYSTSTEDADERPDQTTNSHNPEPGDPENSEYILDRRDNCWIAPPIQEYIDDLPTPLLRCGCGECPDSWHPLAEEGCKKLVGRRCPDPWPVHIETAREIYIRYTRSQWNSTNTSKYERHKERYYPGILEADRILRYLYDLTTVMVTRRISPLSKNNNIITPAELDRRLNGGDVRDKMMKSIRYYLDDFQWWYFSVTAPTESFGTPHEHLYIYVEDPGNEVTVSQFEPAIEKHLDECKGAYERHHQYDKSGQQGAITIRHDLPLVDEIPEKIDSIKQNCIPTQRCPDDFFQNTQGAQYIATQLPHLHIGDLFDKSQPNPRRTLLDGGVTAWISNYDWFRHSTNLPLPDW